VCVEMGGDLVAQPIFLFFLQRQHFNEKHSGAKATLEK
jgi:hypothetical protein